LLARITRIDVLVVDEWAMAGLTEIERRDFWERGFPWHPRLG
jgi:hypothetical protein